MFSIDVHRVVLCNVYRPTEQTEAAIETEEKVEEDARIRAGEIKAQNSASGKGVKFLFSFIYLFF